METTTDRRGLWTSLQRGRHWTKAWESPEAVVETALGLVDLLPVTKIGENLPARAPPGRFSLCQNGIGLCRNGARQCQDGVSPCQAGGATRRQPVVTPFAGLYLPLNGPGETGKSSKYCVCGCRPPGLVPSIRISRASETNPGRVRKRGNLPLRRYQPM